jgi:hypothetical protein
MSYHLFSSSNDNSELIFRGVIGEVRCGFLLIYAPTPYSAVFLLHAPTPASIKIGFVMVRCALVRSCGLG